MHQSYVCVRPTRGKTIDFFHGFFFHVKKNYYKNNVSLQVLSPLAKNHRTSPVMKLLCVCVCVCACVCVCVCVCLAVFLLLSFQFLICAGLDRALRAVCLRQGGLQRVHGAQRSAHSGSKSTKTTTTNALTIVIFADFFVVVNRSILYYSALASKHRRRIRQPATTKRVLSTKCSVARSNLACRRRAAGAWASIGSSCS